MIVSEHESFAGLRGDSSGADVLGEEVNLFALESDDGVSEESLIPDFEVGVENVEVMSGGIKLFLLVFSARGVERFASEVKESLRECLVVA